MLFMHRRGRGSTASTSANFGRLPVRSIAMRKIRPATTAASSAVAIMSSVAPTSSIIGGSAAARFIIVNGV